MKIYLVGGAVRDKMLGLPVKEKDWVVVGATPEEMLRLGYRQVGKDFPVFLHPETNEEYALARTERKIGRGYTGFDFNAAPTVTLEEDLKRRDLTINAMAQTTEGDLIDPYQGSDDLQNKLLRHVSEAFAEDPVRILRTARFAARYAQLGFKVSPDTNELMKQMVEAGEVDALVSERVWKEFERALGENNPEQFFETLENCGALQILFPEITIRSEGLQALLNATEKNADPSVRFAALLHELSAEKIEKLCDRYRVPNYYRELALLATRFFPVYHELSMLDSNALSDAENIVNFFQNVDAFRREERFRKFIQVCLAIDIYSEGFSELLDMLYSTAKIVTAAEFIQMGVEGIELSQKMHQKRIQLIEQKIEERFGGRSR